MDAQFVLDPYSAATYISSYMMKTDLALSKLMKDACSSVCAAEGNAGQVMRAMGNALLNGQEISVQHVVYVCTGLPFRGCSRETVFVPSCPPSQRTFLVKQDWELKSLPPESTDCMALSLVDKYAFRKSNAHLRELGADSVCLADFAALFSLDQKCRLPEDDADEDAATDVQSSLSSTDCKIIAFFDSFIQLQSDNTYKHLYRPVLPYQALRRIPALQNHFIPNIAKASHESRLEILHQPLSRVPTAKPALGAKRSSPPHFTLLFDD
jgi:hypothetical protein